MRILPTYRISSQRTTSVVVALFLIGCLLRVLMVVVAMRSTQYNPYHQIHGSDMASYTALAVSLVKGEGYSDHYADVLPDFFRDPQHFRPSAPPHPTAYRAVGYPLFLSLIFRICGYHLVPVLLIQALLSAVSTLLVYAIGRQVGSWKLALFAYAVAVFYYPFWYYTMMLMVETVLIFLTLLVLYGLIRWFIKPTVITAWWTGLALGAAFLVKPLILPIIPLYLVIAYLRWRRHNMRRAFWTGVTALVVVVMLVLAPLAIRNYRHTGRAFVTPSFGGYQFLLLYNRYNEDFSIYRDPGFVDQCYPGFCDVILPELALVFPEHTNPVLAEYLQDQAYARAAQQFALRHPWQSFRIVLRTVWNMWRINYPRANIWQTVSNLLCYAGLAPFVVLGMVRAVRRRNLAAFLLSGFLLYIVGFHAILASMIRYRMVAMPVWFVLGALGLSEAGQWWRKNFSPGIS